jgi:DNA-3-methyladenine glycosylase
MTVNRSSKRKDLGSGLKEKDLCNGPSKLCAAFNITKMEFNQQHISACQSLWLEGKNIAGNDVEHFFEDLLGCKSLIDFFILQKELSIPPRR